MSTCLAAQHRATLQDPASPLTSYEDFKRTHQGTEALCSAEGLGFTPMVVEARGGAWGPAVVKVFAELAQTKALITGELVETLHQNLGVVLHRENARAALKRLRTHTHHTDSVLNAATALQSSAAAANDANAM